ncbi:helix-turn-helix domain-containing protein [Candidatus Nitrosotalea bavarica]|uniref:helix-turn-helix domain-containing protein n=1 Tax=Candidatus Nitrosotalea bavarica TaxID=1903277 RepID=UPI000C714932|nr:helix-turn-helix domain-containing protein [Candidatus Nitrosotalea bavarica]
MSRKAELQMRRTTSPFVTNEEKVHSIHFLNERKELLADLMNMGFEESEAIMYLGLLHIGPVTIGNLAIKLGLDRGKMYRSLTKLRNYGLVTTSFSNPVIVTATEPSKALDTIVEKKRDELDSMKKLSEKVITNLKTNKTDFGTSDTSSFSVLQSRTIIYNRIGRILDESDSNLVYIVTTTNDIAKMYYTSIPEKIQNAKKNHAIIRVITEDKPTKAISEMIKRLNASEVRVGELPSRGRMIVEKERQLVMSESSKSSADSGNSDVAIHTNSLEFVQNMFSLCEYLWNNSKEFVEI